jgi:hypothetical protein
LWYQSDGEPGQDPLAAYCDIYITPWFSPTSGRGFNDLLQRWQPRPVMDLYRESRSTIEELV